MNWIRGRRKVELYSFEHKESKNSTQKYRIWIEHKDSRRALTRMGIGSPLCSQETSVGGISLTIAWLEFLHL
jgi:hypothetical protein